MNVMVQTTDVQTTDLGESRENSTVPTGMI